MAIVNPERSRVTISDGGDNLVVEIPVKRNWYILLFLSFWLCGWALGEMAAIGGLVGGAFGLFSRMEGSGNAGMPAGLFLIVWLCGWTLGGAFAMAAWVYQLKGKEVIKRDGRYLTHQRDFLVYKRSKEYMNDHIKDLRISTAGGSMFQMDPERAMEFWGMGGGVLVFDYGSKTIRIGAGLDEAEAKPILQSLKKFG